MYHFQPGGEAVKVLKQVTALLVKWIAPYSRSPAVICIASNSTGHYIQYSCPQPIKLQTAVVLFYNSQTPSIHAGEISISRYSPVGTVEFNPTETQCCAVPSPHTHTHTHNRVLTVEHKTMYCVLSTNKPRG